MQKSKWLILLGFGWLVNAVLATTVSAQTHQDTLQLMLEEVNHVRTNPRQYALKLQPRLQRIKQGFVEAGKPYHKAEAYVSMRSLIRDLQTRNPTHPLRVKTCLATAAKEHALDIFTGGTPFGHKGSDGRFPQQRIETHCGIISGGAENLAIGTSVQDPREVVVRLLVDENVVSRGHRKNILNPDFVFVGNAKVGGVWVQNFSK